MPTFYDRFVECSERWPDNVALELQRHEQLESCTYAELHRMAESIGRWITEHGFQRGSRLAILADNHPRWVAAYLGIIASGCAAVPLDTALHDDQVTKLLKDSGASAVFVDAKHVAVTRPAAKELHLGLILMDPERMTSHSIQEHWLANLPAVFDAGPGKFKPAPANDDDLASLIYTSGTTADPKGVMLTHANFLGEVEAVFNWVDLGPTDALLGVLPLFHVLAQMANLLLPLVKGSRVVYLETLNTTELMRALTERNITAFAVVPQFYYLIHERIFQEIEKRGALTKRVFATMVAVNRMLAIRRLLRTEGMQHNTTYCLGRSRCSTKTYQFQSKAHYSMRFFFFYPSQIRAILLPTYPASRMLEGVVDHAGHSSQESLRRPLDLRRPLRSPLPRLFAMRDKWRH